MLIFLIEWHTILVNEVYYEDGIKPPLKSTPMKILVLASYAQFGVSAESKSIWATAMACAIDPSIRGDLNLLLAYTRNSWWTSDDLGLNLLCDESYE